MFPASLLMCLVKHSWMPEGREQCLKHLLINQGNKLSLGDVGRHFLSLYSLISEKGLYIKANKQS